MRKAQFPVDVHGYARKMNYSLQPIILFANIDVSRHILVIDTSVLAKSIMGRREHKDTGNDARSWGQRAWSDISVSNGEQEC
jgi:hypothetical protein